LEPFQPKRMTVRRRKRVETKDFSWRYPILWRERSIRIFAWSRLSAHSRWN